MLTLEDQWYFFDTQNYHKAAQSIIRGEGFGQGIFVTKEGLTDYSLEPIYPLFLAGCYSILGESFRAVRLVESLIGGFIAVLIAIIGGQIFGKRAGLLAGIIAAIYPYFVFVAGLLYVTNLLTLFILLLVYFNLRYVTSFRLVWLGLASVAAGFVALSTPVMLVVFPFWMAWLIARRRTLVPRIQIAVVAAVGFIVTISPWLWRNYRVFGRITPIRAYMGEISAIDSNLNDDRLRNEKVAGHELRVVVRIDSCQNMFDVFYNGEYKGRLADREKIFTRPEDSTYAGLMLRAGLRNNIDVFEASSYGGDEGCGKRIDNGADPSACVIDEFDDSNLGRNWQAAAEYSVIDGELANTASDSSWNYLAILKTLPGVREVRVRWGRDADGAGAGETGIALLLDEPSLDANGYLVMRLPAGYLTLWTIEDGKPGQSLEFLPELRSSDQPDPFTGLLTSILQEPGPFLGRFFREFANFWNPMPNRVRTTNRFTSKPILWVGALAFGSLLILAIVAVLRIRWSEKTTLLVLMSIAFAAGYALFGTQTRYRIPIDSIIIMFSSYGLLSLLDFRRSRSET